MKFKRKLPTFQEIKEAHPLSEKLQTLKQQNDELVQSIFLGKDDRLLLIIGPCSADREDAVLEYMGRLRDLQEQVKDKILMVPRVYTNKPRTNGVGYKGLMHQPNPHEEPDMVKGIIAMRQLHMKTLEQTGFSCADEMLYPENHYYLSDLLSYVAVGARSVENQKHRLVASGLDIPVGMKNPTGGDLSVMINSIVAAQHAHEFTYANWEVETEGNPLAHAILRGRVNKNGRNIPNYHYEDLRLVHDLYQKSGLQNPAIIVDVNHSNSGKNFEEQIRISKEVLNSARYSEDIGKMIKGLMIESYLVDGNQSPEGGVYGQSITDPCLGWEKTEKLVLDLADMR